MMARHARASVVLLVNLLAAVFVLKLAVGANIAGARSKASPHEAASGAPTAERKAPAEVAARPKARAVGYRLRRHRERV
jgi:hypothetical protein